MYKKYLYCFFNNILEFDKALSAVTSYRFLIFQSYFLLLKSIQCNDTTITATPEQPLFGFCVSISKSFPEKRSPEEVDKDVEKVCNWEFFTDKSRGNFICTMEAIENYFASKYPYPSPLKQDFANYFDTASKVIKYAYEKGIFTMDSIPDDFKSAIKAAIKLGSFPVIDMDKLAT
ncbi:MAG: hypothetical protein BAJALOKI1v1_10025 [Promethearchaeota archaeon]|nr:MAG: hypothetical protein BAJALOKI1v1_10025 [Candidatus Lokiarchaeota archaeon]